MENLFGKPRKNSQDFQNLEFDEVQTKLETGSIDLINLKSQIISQSRLYEIINNLKQKNEDLEKENNIYKDELVVLRLNNKNTLSLKNPHHEQEINHYKHLVDQLQSKINSLEKELCLKADKNNEKNGLRALKKEIEQKNDEINQNKEIIEDLHSKLKRYKEKIEESKKSKSYDLMTERTFSLVLGNFKDPSQLDKKKSTDIKRKGDKLEIQQQNLRKKKRKNEDI